jgi:hypothetical protein
MIGAIVRLAVTAVGAAVVTKAGERAVAHARTQAELYAMKVAAKKARRHWEASAAGKAVNAFKSIFTGEKVSTVIDLEPITTAGEMRNDKLLSAETREKLLDALGASAAAVKATFGELKENAGPLAARAQEKGAVALERARVKLFELRAKRSDKAGGRDE